VARSTAGGPEALSPTCRGYHLIHDSLPSRIDSHSLRSHLVARLGDTVSSNHLGKPRRYILTSGNESESSCCYFLPGRCSRRPIFSSSSGGCLWRFASPCSPVLFFGGGQSNHRTIATGNLKLPKPPGQKETGDKITIHNLRNFDYEPGKPATPRWETKVVDLSQLVEWIFT